MRRSPNKNRLPVIQEADLADKVAKLIRRKLLIEDEKKETAKALNDQIKSLDERIAEKAEVINQGYDERNVDVYLVRDYRSQKVFYYRVDNEELVKTRTMDQFELQQSFPLSHFHQYYKDLKTNR